MPIIKSAIKKMHQDRKKTAVNRIKKDGLKKAIKLAETNPTPENLSHAFSALDKAAKIGLIPQGRADRKKSRLPQVAVASKPRVAKTITTKTKKPTSKKS